ncbi:hypothetical protein EYF80_031429 [Liparis tanakae]|uniref:Uncharacterized protein n=1 Tax=Liparis tanakae TaxID=230148 RepID=A0A4Z2GXX8_9TELE|nr:hypothetical protein EYF80_031429 [Liparis tanakae]
MGPGRRHYCLHITTAEGGEVQTDPMVRDRFWTPRPHGTLQADHSVHRDQPPFTRGSATTIRG